MAALLISAAVSLLFSLVLTPWFIKWLIANEYGQFIRQDGPTGHFTKRGTPTMGGLMIITATIVGWGSASLFEYLTIQRTVDVSSLLLIFLILGLGLIGFLDDWIIISKHRSLGLNPTAKILGQLGVGSIFAGLAVSFPNEYGHTPATFHISFIRDLPIDLAFAGIGLGVVLFLIWANLLVVAWSNAVNLTDGLDGLATGAAVMVFGAYTLISYWQSSQSCRLLAQDPACYDIRDPRGLAIVGAALVGACVGFLWFNGAPAQIFMGDTGSLALGGAVAGFSIMTQTEILAVLIGGLFVIEVFSDVIQIGFFKATRKRVFKMAPLHHHFELKGWGEITVVIRFWIVAGICAALGVGVFYAEWVAR
ncbi:MAG: phospho-N-acetylmuramoyl-pentapeptide-transferase [Actinomycetaceae bacterium]|nr:phospho-N-acetylmuramoyl-pentapeptide-transferase [Actinomycetaceae bacterium]